MLKAKSGWTWMAMVGMLLALVPACMEQETADFESVGDIELEGEPRLLVGEEAIAFHQAQTSGAAIAAGWITLCTRKEFVAPAGGNMVWESCIRNDHLMWLSMVADREISRSYAQLSVAGIDVTTGFRSFPKIVPAPFNNAALVVLDARGMWIPGHRYVASTAVRAANQPWSWPLLSWVQTW